MSWKQREEAIRRYQSDAVTEWLGDISLLCRDIFAIRHKPSLTQMQNLLLLVQQTIKLMEQDDKHIQEMLDAFFERKARESRNNSADLATEDLRIPEQLSPGSGQYHPG